MHSLFDVTKIFIGIFKDYLRIVRLGIHNIEVVRTAWGNPDTLSGFSVRWLVVMSDAHEMRLTPGMSLNHLTRHIFQRYLGDIRDLKA